jgi:hypothetical protein
VNQEAMKRFLVIGQRGDDASRGGLQRLGKTRC